jgi:hypothetical protein
MKNDPGPDKKNNDGKRDNMELWSLFLTESSKGIKWRRKGRLSCSKGQNGSS